MFMYCNNKTIVLTINEDRKQKYNSLCYYYSIIVYWNTFSSRMII